MSRGAPEFARIAADVVLGRGVVIHGLVNLYGCEIGDETKVGAFVEIQKGARVGKRCKVSSHSFVCEGVTLEDEVFVGHGVMFTNVPYPKATSESGDLRTDADWECVSTLVRRGASIGSGSVILCGITIGEGAMLGAGSVLTSDVPPGEVWAGNPARFMKKAS